MSHENTKPVLCFIDDDQVEVDVFKNVFGDGDEFVVLAETSQVKLAEELQKLGRQPNLFVLDMYFPLGKESTEDEKKKMIELKTKVNQAQKELADYLDSIGQSRLGGIKLLKNIRHDFPGVPIVFYTRKGTLEDANVCKHEGADDVLQKPQLTNFDPNKDVRFQLEEAAGDQRSILTGTFARLASSTGYFPIRWLKKIRRVIIIAIRMWPKA